MDYEKIIEAKKIIEKNISLAKALNKQQFLNEMILLLKVFKFLCGDK